MSDRFEDEKEFAFQLDAKHFTLPNEVEQVLLVTAMQGSSRGSLYAFEKKGDFWEETFHTIPVSLGRSGMTNQKTEGDGKSPIGLYKLGTAFGIDSKPKYVQMPYKEIDSQDKFINDPEHPDYNTWVHGDTDAKSYEKMYRKDECYDLGVVIEYNMNPVVTSMGSAIFIHIWKSRNKSTEGCVAMSRADLEDLLEWLKPECNPHIYILES